MIHPLNVWEVWWFLNIFVPPRLLISKAYWSTDKCFSIMDWGICNRYRVIDAVQDCTHQTEKLRPCPCLWFANSCLLFSQAPTDLEIVWQDIVFCLDQIPLRNVVFHSSKFLYGEQHFIVSKSTWRFLERWIFLFFQSLQSVDISVRRRNTKETLYASCQLCIWWYLWRIFRHPNDGSVWELRMEHNKPLNGRVIVEEYTLVLSKYLGFPFVKKKHLNVGTFKCYHSSSSPTWGENSRQ